MRIDTTAVLEEWKARARESALPVAPDSPTVTTYLSAVLSRVMREDAPSVGESPLAEGGLNVHPRDALPGLFIQNPGIAWDALLLLRGIMTETLGERPPDGPSRLGAIHRIFDGELRAVMEGAVHRTQSEARRYREECCSRTEREQYESALALQKTLLEAQIEASIDGVVVTSPDREILSYNRRFVEIWGIPDEVVVAGSREAMVEFAIGKMRSPESFLQELDDLYAHPEEERHSLMHLTDGRIFDRYSAPVRGEGGVLLGRIWYVRDVTEHVKAEESLRNVLRHARCILWSAQIRVRDRRPRWSGSVFDVEAAQQILPLDVPPGQDYTTVWYACRHPEDQRRMNENSHDALLTGRESYRQEFRCTNRYGGEQWLTEDVALRKLGPGHWEAIGVCTDVTERKRMEQQLLQAQKMEAVGQFAGGMAHDFNNLLSVINGFSELLLQRLTPDDPMAKPLEQILHAGERGATLTRQLLAFSRRQILAPRVLDLNETVSRMSQMLRRLLSDDIEIALDLAPAPALARVDPTQMEQVILNLSANARDAMPQGGRLTFETGRLRLRDGREGSDPSLPPGNYVTLTVRDTGTGMSPEVLRRIFEPFYTTKGSGKGTGLGLSTAHGILRQSGGAIRAESGEGRGSAFFVCLPEAEGEPESESPAPKEALPGGTETVLLTEDDEMVRAYVRQVLHSCGYRVLEAGSGGEALSHLLSHPGPMHLLLTDAVMAKMSGSELARRVKRLRPEVRVLYMSGYTDDECVRAGVETAAASFLQKPFSAASLARKVRDVLDSGPITG